MATLGTNTLTLADIAKRMDPNLKDIAAIVEVLTAQNDILKFLPFLEGNLPTGHRTTIRSGLPTVGTRRINSGVTPGKSTTQQVDDATMLLEAYSEVDEEALRLSGNPAETRASEDVATMEAMNQFFSTTFFYGNAAQFVDRFHGIATRYSSLSGPYASNIIDAGGTQTDNTSIYMCGLGERGLAGIYPKGTNAGMTRTDLGQQVIQESGNRRTVQMTKFVWHGGISLKDWRHVVRVCNIDVSNLATFGTGSDTSARLLRHMIQAMNILPANPSGYGLKYVFLVNKTVKTWADIMTTEKTNGMFTMKEIYGQEFTMFRQIPIIVCDAITNAESRVT